MTKLYIVEYRGYRANECIEPDLDHLKQCEYVGTSYEQALAKVKSFAKWSGDCKIYSIDLDNVQDLSSDNTIIENKKLVKLATDFENYLAYICSARSHLIKNGKITITLDKEGVDTPESRMKFPKCGSRSRVNKVWTKYEIELADRMAILKIVADKYIADNHITTPIKINFDGKTYCKYNQK